MDGVEEATDGLTQVLEALSPQAESVPPAERLPGIEAVPEEKLALYFGDRPRVFYKVLNRDNCAFHARSYTPFQYDPPKEDGTPGAWTEVIEDTRICSRGYHVTHSPQNWSGHYDTTRIYEVEVKGITFDRESQWSDAEARYVDGLADKAVCQSIRLLREVTAEWKAAYAEEEAERQRQIAEARAEAERKRQEERGALRIQIDDDFIDRMLKANHENKLFIPSNDPRVVVEALMKLPCEHCGDTDWGVDETETWTEYRTTKKQFYRDRRGTIETEGSNDYDTPQREEVERRYTCCHSHVEAHDFSNSVVFAGARDAEDYIIAFLDAIEVG